jgi:hypothetical protein
VHRLPTPELNRNRHKGTKETSQAGEKSKAQKTSHIATCREEGEEEEGEAAIKITNLLKLDEE